MMKKKKRMIEQYKTWIWSVVGIAVCIVLGALLSGCSLTKYVPVPEVHTEHHWHTDSVLKHDSTYHETTTTIMQLDSAAMAAYGIRLQKAERAWLVKTQEMERIIQELMAKSERKDTVHDSIPYPVKEIVIQEPAWVVKGRRYMASIVLCLIAVVVIIYTGKRWLRL